MSVWTHPEPDHSCCKLQNVSVTDQVAKLKIKLDHDGNLWTSEPIFPLGTKNDWLTSISKIKSTYKCKHLSAYIPAKFSEAIG